MADAPRGIRNNNPTNLIHSSLNKWIGLAEPPNDGRFCVFTDMPSGIRAAALNLQAYQDRHGLRTIRELVSRWAPQSENDVDAYIATVCVETGFGEAQMLDLHTYAQAKPFLRGMIRQECGAIGARAVSDAQIDEGLRRAGIVPPAAPARRDSQISLNTLSAGATTIATTIAATEPVWNTFAKINPNLPIVIVAVLGGLAALTAVGFVVTRVIDRRRGVA